MSRAIGLGERYRKLLRQCGVARGAFAGVSAIPPRAVAKLEDGPAKRGEGTTCEVGGACLLEEREGNIQMRFPLVLLVG